MNNLKLPLAGSRYYDSASTIYDQDSLGVYWSSTPADIADIYSYILDFGPDENSVVANDQEDRAYAHSVRCFKDPFYTPETLWTCTTTTTGTALLVNWTGGVRATTMINYSDARIKTNIQKINNALADITRLNGYEFTWIEWSKPDFGVLAQEVEKVFASMASEDSKGIKAVNYTELLAPIIEAIHEINTRVDELTREAQEQALRIETLEK